MNQNLQADKSKNKGPSARLAFYLSAFVFPGAGQLAQKRWLAGILYALSFVACTVFLMVAVLAPMMENLRLSIDFASTGKAVVFRQISFTRVLAWLGLGISVYIAGLLDTIWYNNRMQRRAREAELMAQISGGGERAENGNN